MGAMYPLPPSRLPGCWEGNSLGRRRDCKLVGNRTHRLPSGDENVCFDDVPASITHN